MKADRNSESARDPGCPQSAPEASSWPKLDFAMGFLIASALSVFSFYTLPYIGNRRKRRQGMFYGCIVSLVSLFFLGLTTGCYSAYTKNVRKQNALLKLARKPVLSQLSFGAYLVRAVQDVLRGRLPMRNPISYPAERKLLQRSAAEEVRKVGIARKVLV